MRILISALAIMLIGLALSLRTYGLGLEGPSLGLEASAMAAAPLRGVYSDTTQLSPINERSYPVCRS